MLLIMSFPNQLCYRITSGICLDSQLECKILSNFLKILVWILPGDSGVTKIDLAPTKLAPKISVKYLVTDNNCFY